MSRSTIVAFAIFAAVLAATAPVAAQSSGLVVASQHSTDSDFKNADTLTNLTVQGTGSSASAELKPKYTIIDGFEDGDIGEYGGATSNFRTVSSPVFGGSFALEGTASGSTRTIASTSGLAQYPEAGDTIRVRTRANTSGDVRAFYFGAQSEQSFPNAYRVVLDDDTGRFLLEKRNSSGLVTLASSAQQFGVNQWDIVEVDWGKDGEITATVYDSAGNKLNSVTATDSEYTNGGIGFVTGAKNNDGVFGAYWDGYRVIDSYPQDSQYISQNHSVSDSEKGWANLSLENSTGTVEWQGWTGTQWQVVNSSTYSNTGNYTLDISGTSYSKWRVNVTFEKTGANPTAQLHDEGILFAPRSPNITSASPAPGSETSEPEVNLSADVEDPDFATAQGDSVTVEFLLDGSQVDEQTITSNQTVTTTVQPSIGGTHNWSVNVEDSYGETDSIATREFSVPSTITIRDEQNPGKLINDTSVQVTAYYSGEIEKRTVNNGKLDLSGFPVDEPIIMRFNATNYTTRTAVVESIYDQDSVFLLNDSTPQYLVRFQSQQLTGDFPEEDTVLFIERDITLNGSTEWRTIAGDEFGVRGVPVHLQEDERYRVRIKNLETKQTAVIGGYTAVQSETVDVTAGSAQIDIEGTNKSYGWSIAENESGQHILVEYADAANQTESIKLTIHERFNESNVLVDNETFTNTNNLIREIPLTSDQTNKTWTAELYVDRGDGYMHFRVPIGGGPTDILPSNLDKVWVQAIGVFVMLITGMAFSTLNQGVGAISLSLVGGLLWYIGILGVTTVGAAVVASLAVSLVYHYRTGGGV